MRMEGRDGAVERFNIAKDIRFLTFLERYAAKKGISSIKSLSLKFNGKTLFLDHLHGTPSELGMNDQDLISVSIRSPSSSHERAPLKQLNEANVSRNPRTKSSKGKAKGNRNRSSIRVSPKDQEENPKEQHLKAMLLVFNEADKQFREIRKILNDTSLERMVPKDKSKPKPAPSVMPAPDPPSDVAIAPKAGKSFFVIRVGEASNLFKTAKPQAKGCGCPLRPPRLVGDVDLHGLTKERALAKLEKILPEWIDTAMRETYPFLIQVKVVCGGGSQILAEAVEKWIREKKNVAKAPQKN